MGAAPDLRSLAHSGLHVAGRRWQAGECLSSTIAGLLHTPGPHIRSARPAIGLSTRLRSRASQTPRVMFGAYGIGPSISDTPPM